MQYLVVGAAIVGLLVAMNFFGIRRPQPYLFVGILLWLALLQSGVHATLAGASLPPLPFQQNLALNPALFTSHARVALSFR